MRILFSARIIYPFYLGSTISDLAKLDKELMYRLGKASCCVSPTVWIRDIDTYQFEVQLMHVFMMKYTRQIMNVSRLDKITNLEIPKMADCHSWSI